MERWTKRSLIIPQLQITEVRGKRMCETGYKKDKYNNTACIINVLLRRKVWAQFSAPSGHKYKKAIHSQSPTPPQTPLSSNLLWIKIRQTNNRELWLDTRLKRLPVRLFLIHEQREISFWIFVLLQQQQPCIQQDPPTPTNRFFNQPSLFQPNNI